LVVRRQAVEKGGGPLVGVLAVEIVGIDHGEVFLHRVARGAHGVGGAPGFFAAFRHAESGGQVVELLENVVHLDPVGEARADPLFEGLREILADDENHPAEAGADGVNTE
jgi:hypothetical protein